MRPVAPGTDPFPVPGDPAALRADAARLLGAAAGCDRTDRRVAKAEAGSWEGSAADAFDRMRSRVAAAWADDSDVLTAAGHQLAHYADALEQAQIRAAAAAAGFDRGVALTEAAVADHNASVRVRAATRPPVAVPPFRDPGEAVRAGPLADAAAATASLSVVADVTAAALRAAAHAAPTSPVVRQPTDVNPDYDHGQVAGGPITGLTTDRAALEEMLQLARSQGTQARLYGGLLRQYWAVRAAQDAGIDLDRWDPRLGSGHDAVTIGAVYRYYGDVFLAHPEMHWMGMANGVGATFAAGFLDLATIRVLAAGLLRRLPAAPTFPVPTGVQDGLRAVAEMSDSDVAFYEATFLGMQKEIFCDQGGMHAAYLHGGLNAVAELRSAHIIDDRTLGAWRDIDSRESLSDANRAFALREQVDIIADDYQRMEAHPRTGEAFTYLMTTIGSVSVPGTRTPAEVDPVSVPLQTFPLHLPAYVTTPFPAFNVADANARWAMVTTDTLPAYERLLRDHPEQARDLAAAEIWPRIIDQGVGEQLDDILARLATGWSVHTGHPPADPLAGRLAGAGSG